MFKLERAALLLAGVSAAAFSHQAIAAQAPTATAPAAAPQAQAAPSDAEIIVTGSRIAHTTFDTPTPTTSIGEVQLKAKAATSVVDLLRDLPALRPNRNNGSATDVGASTFNIRSLGPTRTLLLIDGQRVMNSSPTGGFDLNLLPAPLVKRMDVVTGGVSSVYGSDAVTGVVNVFLDGELTGGRADLQFNVTGQGDNKTYSANLAWGKKFADGRGHLVIAGSFFDRPDILYQGSRGWGSTGVTLIPNATYTATNGQYRQLIVPNAQLSSMTYGGVITSAGALKNIQFGPGGAQSLFQQGTNVTSTWMQGGGGLMLQPQLGVLIPSAQRYNGYARASFEITPDTEVHADVLYARSVQRQTNNYNYNAGDITIKSDNPFIPANIKAIMLANNMSSFTMGRLNPELGLNDNTSTTSYIRSTLGIKGKLGGSWSWDATTMYTNSIYSNISLNNRNNANWTNALDAVAGPNGTAICRSTLTNPGNGCVAANPFGENSVSAAAAAYATGTSWINSVSTQFDANANVKGSPFSTWAGKVQTAFGVEYRRETVGLTSDPVSAINGWRQASSAPYSGAVSVEEGYVEAGVPLLRDKPFARDVQVDLAGRYVHYSTSGGTAVWKVGLNWNVSHDVRFRGTVSRDFRAPTINELFAANTLRAGTIVSDVNGQSVTVLTLLGGNSKLKPESAHTVTFGVVLRPSFFDGFQVSVDAFNIDLDNAITSLGAQEVVQRCAAGDQTFCAALTRNAAGVLTQVQITTFNAQTLKTRGLDIEASYQTPLDRLFHGAQGALALSTTATYVDRLTTTSNGVTTNTAGQLTGTNATPKWRASTTLTYSNGPWQLRALGNFVGGGAYDNTYGPLDLNYDHFAGRYYVDLTATYDVTKAVQLYAKVENLTNAPPPLVAENTIVRAGAANASSFYDVIGRNFGVGMRARW